MVRLSVVSISLSITMFSVAAIAQTDSLRMKQDEARPAVRSSVKGRLTLANDEYISSSQTYFRGDADRSHPTIALGVDLDLRKSVFGLRLNGRDQYVASEQWNYLIVKEVAVQWRPGDLSTFSLGRKLDRWNEWEGEWHQGVFQPRYMLNKLRSEEAGLAGIFYNQDTQPVAFAVGFLPVHVPDLGSRFYVEDDKFTSRNPWFNPPAAQFEYRNAIGDMHYTLNKPTISEATSHMGGVAKVEFDAGKYFGRISGAYKPMPQFLLGFPSRNRVFVTDAGDYMSVEVTPRTAYHTLLSHDSMIKAGAWTLTGGLTREVPDLDDSPENYTAQQVAPAWIYSASVSRPLEQEGPYAARVKLGFLKIEGGDAPDRGDFASAQSTLFERRYQYNEAYSLGLSKMWRGRGPLFSLDTGMRLVYDRLQNGGVASFSAGMIFSKQFRADLEVDFLGLFSGPAEVEDGFLALYRANDRVGLGLSFVY